MTRKVGKLSARFVATAKPGKYSDGGNLWLFVSNTGARRWVFRYVRGNKERQMGLGATHTVTLAQARDAALQARQAMHAGLDPIEQRNAKRLAGAGIPTFEEAYIAFIDQHQAGWDSAKHGKQWRSTLDTYAKPLIGPKRVSEISTDDVLSVLSPIWTTKTETATRVRQRIEQVLDAEKVKGHRSGENPARWRGHLDKLLPSPKKVRPVKHFPALPYADAPNFMAELRKKDELAARALEFLILTASRTEMVTQAEWNEIKEDIWTVPAERMKTRREHRVPLPAAALQLLEALPREQGAGVFPGARKRHLSNGAMDRLLQVRMGYLSITVHGFRSTFKDWASEKTSFPNIVSEAALGHAISDKVEAAYRRGELLEKRRELMEAWATYLGSPTQQKEQ